MAGETTVDDLIKEIKRGDLILPEFQRGYVWDRTKVRAFLNSLYRGYPTGTFLVWKTPTAPKVRGGAPPSDGASYRLILDGQQRLTSIFVVMEGSVPPFYEGDKLPDFPLHFNVVKQEFAYYKKSVMAGNPEWVPVTAFLKRGLAGFLQDVGGDPQAMAFYVANLPKLGRLESIKNYLYYVKELTELDMDVVVDVFNLVNSTGTPLSKSDLALAHMSSKWLEARETFRRAKTHYATLGFDWDLSFYTRCTSITATGSALYDPLYRTPGDDIIAAWPKVTKALDYVLNVLRGDGFIDSSNAFPSFYPVVPLVSYLTLTGRDKFDSDAEKRAFLHWMYAALMWGRYSGSTDTKLQADIEAIRGPEPTSRLRENLIAERGRIKVEAKDLEGAGVKNPLYPMTYIVARSRGAVDWFNGISLYQKAIGKSMGLEAHHIFPVAFLYRSGLDALNPDDKRKVNEISNLAFLTQQANLKISDKDPSVYLPKVLEQYPHALTQQAVPQNPALWNVAVFDSFLGERRRLLAEAINTFMDSLLAPESREGLTINDFIARGEGPHLEFKSSVRWDHRQGVVNKALEHVVAKTVAGFMNHEGGTLVLGVTDEGSLVGVEADMQTLKKPNQDGLALHLTEVLSRYLGALEAVAVDVSFAQIDSKTVVVMRADRAPHPVFVDNQDMPEFYVRSGASTRPLNVKEASDYIAEHWKDAA